MINPYEIQERVLTYLEDADQLPLIRQTINEAIQFICQAHDKGKDWSFLVGTETLTVTGSGTVATVDLPKNVRSVIDVKPTSGTAECELYGRTIIVKAPEGGSLPASVTVRYYKAHPPVYALVQHDGGTLGPEYDSNGSNAEWTLANPPSPLVLLPDEAIDAVVYETLLLLRIHEIEIAANSQYCEKMAETAIAFLKGNYQLQIDYRTPVTDAQDGSQTENLTVGWLVDYGKVIVGGERDEYQLISLVNRVASEFADKLRLRGDQRPKIRNKLTDTLPTFGGVAGFSMSGSTTEKAIPANFWQMGMRYHCLKATKQVDDLAAAEYRETLDALVSLFYSLKTSGVYDYSTYGGMMDYLRSIWGNQQSDLTLWSVLNQTVAEVMRAVNTGETMTCKEYEVTEESKNDFDLPDDFKVAVKVTLGDRYEIISRPFTARGRTRAEQQIWQFPGDWHRNLRHPNYYCLLGKKLHFHHDLPVNATIKMWYYPKHVWPYVTVDGKKQFDLTKEIPVDVDLVSLALRAKVALEQKDLNTYKVYDQDYQKALEEHKEAQNRSLAEDDCFIAAEPPVDFLLACNTYGVGDF